MKLRGRKTRNFTGCRWRCLKKTLAQLMDGSRGFFSLLVDADEKSQVFENTLHSTVNAICSVQSGNRQRFCDGDVRVGGCVCQRKGQLERRSKQTNLGDGQRNKTMK